MNCICAEMGNSCDHVLISSGCCSKLPHTGWLKTVDVYLLTILKVSRPESGVSVAKPLLKHQSQTFWAPEAGFVEDSFSTNGVGKDGFRMIQVHLLCTLFLI